MRFESIVLPVMRQVIKHDRLADRLFGMDSWGNPFSTENNADPYAILDIVHEEGPVSYKALYRQWFVTGYEETKTVLASPDAITRPQIEVMLDVRPYTKLNHSARSFLENLLIGIDPPDHTRLRGLVNRAFTPRQVARLDERMDTIIGDLIAELDPTRPDVVNGFNVAFPVHVISELLGVPKERWPWVREMSATMTKLLDPFRGFDADVMNKDLDDFHRYVVELAAERRADPRDDLMTGLALAEQDGDRLSEDELVAVFGMILFAGHETTAGLLGNALIALEQFPEQRAWIRDNPDQWPNAVDELVRFDTSVRSDPRAAARDIPIGDTVIPAGANIAVLIAMANRDPRRYDDPNALKLDRSNIQPISFGHGIHYCLGANLARMETRKGLHALLDHFGDYTIDTSQTEWKPSLTLRGPIHITLRPE